VRLAQQHLTGHQTLELVLDYVETAPEDEVVGLTAALRCLLSPDEISAETLVTLTRRTAREQRERAQRARLKQQLEDARDAAVALAHALEPLDAQTKTWARAHDEAVCTASDLEEVLETFE
jgi:hypothetical protein